MWQRALLFLLLLPGVSAADDTLVKLEPPSPIETQQMWGRVRREQRTLRETMALWGISSSLQAVEQSATDFVPGLVSARIGMASPDQLDLSMEMGLPRNAAGLQFAASFDLKQTADSASLFANVKLTIRGTGISAKGSWSEDKGLMLEGGAAWDHALHTIGASIDTAGQASGSLTFKLGPAQVKVDPSKWVQRARHFLPRLGGPLEQASRTAVPKVGGVLIQFDPGRMAKAMSDKPPRGLGSVVLVSLRRAMEANTDLGMCTSITGVLVDHAAQDIVLIGEEVPGQPPIPIGLVAEVFRSVQRDGLAPWVSIDPVSSRDPNTRHRARFGGVSAGLEKSLLVQVLLDADIALKTFHLGGQRVAGISSYFELEVEDSRRPRPVGLANRSGLAQPMDRIWLAPRQPGIGEIWRTTSPAGALYVFPSGVMIQTESMRVSADGSGVESDNKTATNTIAQLAVLSCTHEYARLADALPALRRVPQVFQLATAASILRTERVRSPIFDALARLPLKAVSHRRMYQGVPPRRIGTTRFAIWGGVESRVRLDPSRFRGVDALRTTLAGVRGLRWASPAVRAYGVSWPAIREGRIANRRLMAARYLDDAVADLASGDLVSSERRLRRSLAIDPELETAFDQLAMVLYRRGDAAGAHEAWTHAIELNPTPGLHYKRGVVLVQQGRWREAAADFETTVHSDPANASAHFNLGKAKEALRDSQSAINAYGRALVADSHHKGSLLNRGRLRKKLGDAPGAMADYTALLKIDPTYTLGYFNRGLLNKSLGDLTGAIADFTSYIELAARDHEGHYMRALVHRLAGHDAEAIADYAEAIRLAPRNVRSFVGRALAHAKASRRDQALKDLERALALEPRHPQARALAILLRAGLPRPPPPGDAVAWANAGGTAAQRGQYSDAIALLTHALDSGQLDAEQSAMTLINRSITYLEMGFYDGAVRDALQAVKLAPRDAGAHVVAGNAHLSAGDLDKARASLTEAIRLRPHDELALSNRALVHEVLGKRQAAIADYRKALATNPGSGVAAAALHRLTGESITATHPSDPIDLANAATLAGKRGDFEAARRLYTHALESGGLSRQHAALAYFSRGVIHVELRRFDDAVADLRRAIDMLPTHAPAFVALGNAYLGKAEPKSAVAAYAEALRLQPKLLLAYRNRAQAYERLGRPEEAKADYRKVLELDPGDSAAKAALQRLGG